MCKCEYGSVLFRKNKVIHLMIQIIQNDSNDSFNKMI